MNKSYYILIGLFILGAIIIFPLDEKSKTSQDSPAVTTEPEKKVTKTREPERLPISKPTYKAPDLSKKTDLKETLYLEELAAANPKAHKYVLSEKALREKGYGHLEHVKNINNPQVRSVIEALKSGLYPERLSPAIAPAPFNKAKFTSDPEYAQKYMDTVEPGRVLQGENPGDAPAIKRISPYLQNVEQGKSVVLAVKCEPGFPCTFTSYDNGVFDNGLSSQTVIADGSGTARVSFHGVSGVGGDSKIFTSSPVNSGRIKFIVYTKGSL